MFVPPMSTATIASAPRKVHGRASCVAPMSAASSGSYRMGSMRIGCPEPLRSTAARPVMTAPTRLPLSPPPMTMRWVSRQSSSLRKQRMTSASSAENSSMAVCTRPASSAEPDRIARSSFFFESFWSDGPGSGSCATIALTRSRQSRTMASNARREARSSSEAVLVTKLLAVRVDGDERKLRHSRSDHG